jgi:DNA polymerase III subunit epsilon
MMNFDEMADKLSAHPDFKVKRRLVPILDFGPGSGAPTKRVLILDTETTGLDWRAENIIELAMLSVAVDLQTGQPVGVVEVYEDFEDPGRPIPAEIVKLTGITTQDVKGQKLNEAKIIDMVQRADLIVAHNASFDRPFVENRLEVFEHKAWPARLLASTGKPRFGVGQVGIFMQRIGMVLRRAPCTSRLPCFAAGLVGALEAQPDDIPSTGLQQLFKSAEQARTVVKAFGSPFETKDKLKARGYRWMPKPKFGLRL